MQIHAHLLINTDSRRGRQALPAIKRALEEQNISLVKTHDLHRVSMRDCIHRITTAQPSLLLLAGGDGTVSGALGYLSGEQGIEIGIIPLGTTNNFARSLGIPLTVSDAISTIANTPAHPVDLGRVSNRTFANVTGIGLSAAIAAHVDDCHKKLLGRLAYGLSGLRQLITHRPFTVTISDPENKLVMSYETHQLIVANGRFHAGKQIAVDAEIDNRELVIFPLGGRSRLSLFWHTLDFYLGRRKKIVHSPYLTGKQVKVKMSRPQPLEIDGEPAKPQTEAEFLVVPNAVMVRYQS
jgi:YegS/Rv2252/BmrU family lipid kinase